MKQKTILALITLIFPVAVLAQEDVRNIHWDNGLNKTFLGEEMFSYVLDFDGATLSEHTGMLPVYSERLPLPGERYGIEAVITDPVCDSIPRSDIELLDDAGKIKNTWDVRSENILVRKKPYAEVSFVPIRYNDSSGVYEKLLSFTLEYTIVAMDNVHADQLTSYPEASVLSAGDWYRIGVDETGIYKISFDDLEGMGMDVSSLDPRHIRLYGNGNGMVPESNGESRYHDLKENAIVVAGEEDGSFDPQDYILFYGLSPVVWKYNVFTGLFEHALNYYSDQTFYFLTADLGPGKRIRKDSLVSAEPTDTITHFTDYAYHEEELVNILKSGKIWFGEQYKDQLAYDYHFLFPNLAPGSKVSLRTNLAARSTQNSTFHFTANSMPLMSVEVNKINLNSQVVYAYSTTPDTVSFMPGSDEVNLRVEYEQTSNVAEGWMNYIELNARRKLHMEGPQMLFRDHRKYGAGRTGLFRLSGAPGTVSVWDVTDRFEVKIVPGDLNGDEYVFRASTDKLKEYLAYDGTDYYAVDFIEKVANQNLHSMSPADYIIIAPEMFRDQAVRLGQIHQQYDGLSYLVVSPQEIFNEFSSGAQDIGAIRDFCRMLYQKADEENLPRYLLLFGDGSYDPKCRDVPNCNKVPTFQSMESLKYGYSYVADDFYGLYDSNEGNNGYYKTIDIGIGRFPVNTVEEAVAAVDKIEHYITGKTNVMDDWRNLICFIADDEDNNIHFKQAERLQAIIDTTYVDYNIDKIYIDAYKQVSTPNGQRYPEVNDAITGAVRRGALIINYTGHGGESGWTHEHVLDIPTINAWENFDNLPLFITATCTFSRFDDPAITSAGEWVFLNPDGGGIGLFSTTRLAWSDPNFKLNRIIYQYAFEREDGEYPRLGDLIRISKTIMSNSQNIKNFVLLGDPALKLAYPEHKVVTTSVHALPFDGSAGDTIQSLQEVTVEGEVLDKDGTLFSEFNGIVMPTVFDKKLVRETLGNDGSSQVASFDLQNMSLFKGRSRVQNGRFSFSFIVPKDIMHHYGAGKISYYAYDTITYMDANGYSEVVIGGMAPGGIMDQTGPRIDIFLDDLGFVSGDYVNPDPFLMAYLWDEHGINSTGIGIGHEITGFIDGNLRQPLNLNPYFRADMDSYQGGWIELPLQTLPDGQHTLEIRAWDILNNPSSRRVVFLINKFGDLDVVKAVNYPNPFHDRTFFRFDHNKPGASLDVEIDIYTITGQRVRTLKANSATTSGSIEPLAWDGTDGSGNKLGKGTYVYRVKVWDDQGSYHEYSQKLIIGR